MNTKQNATNNERNAKVVMSETSRDTDKRLPHGWEGSFRKRRKGQQEMMADKALAWW